MLRSAFFVKNNLSYIYDYKNINRIFTIIKNIENPKFGKKYLLY
jgi:hypothetical protein